MEGYHFYFGELSSNKKHGFGIGYDEGEKACYIGFWKNNFCDGLGIFKQAGANKIGMWEQGQLIEKMSKEELIERIKSERVGRKVIEMSLKQVMKMVEEVKNENALLIWQG